MFKGSNKASSRDGEKKLGYAGHGDRGRIWSIEEHRFMVEEGDVYFHLDVGHANLDVEKIRVEDFLKAFPPGSKLIHVHVFDNFGGSALKGWNLHLPLGAGRINWARVFRLLRSYGYSGTVTIEIFSRDREYLEISLKKANCSFSTVSRKTSGRECIQTPCQMGLL